MVDVRDVGSDIYLFNFVPMESGQLWFNNV